MNLAAKFGARERPQNLHAYDEDATLFDLAATLTMPCNGWHSAAPTAIRLLDVTKTPALIEARRFIGVRLQCMGYAAL